MPTMKEHLHQCQNHQGSHLAYEFATNFTHKLSTPPAIVSSFLRLPMMVFGRCNFRNCIAQKMGVYRVPTLVYKPNRRNAHAYGKKVAKCDKLNFGTFCAKTGMQWIIELFTTWFFENKSSNPDIIDRPKERIGPPQNIPKTPKHRRIFGCQRVDAKSHTC